MIDQLIIGSKSSYDDFEASVKERIIGTPKKKSIKDTVPFSNITYDFSKINGEMYWEERTLKYVFEILEDSPETMEKKKQDFLSWIMNVFEDEIHDPFIEGWHFVGTYDDSSCDDSEFYKTTITVTFPVYPYMIANKAKVYTVNLTAGTESVISVENNSSHRITPTFVNDVAITIKTDNMTYSVGAGETTDASLMIEMGITTFVISSANDGTVNIVLNEEIF